MPDLPGYIATGTSVSEVEQLIREAISFHLEGLREDGIEIPEPSCAIGYVELAAQSEHGEGSRATPARLPTMQLGYTILHVADVASSLSFFKRAFGFKRRFLHESETYGELETGNTTLSFAAHELADGNFPGGHVRANESKAPLGMEIGLVTTDVASAHAHALREGAIELSAPVTKPWGQIVSYVRAPNTVWTEAMTPYPGKAGELLGFHQPPEQGMGLQQEGRGHQEANGARSASMAGSCS